MFEIVIRRRAARYFKRLPQNLQNRIKNTLRQLRTSPLQMPGTKKMAGEWAGYHRLRVGHIRIIFWIDENKRNIYVDEIGPRGDVYR
jgi:mRNA interferase RelE/StbE